VHLQTIFVSASTDNFCICIYRQFLYLHLQDTLCLNTFGFYLYDSFECSQIRNKFKSTFYVTLLAQFMYFGYIFPVASRKVICSVCYTHSQFPFPLPDIPPKSLYFSRNKEYLRLNHAGHCQIN